MKTKRLVVMVAILWVIAAAAFGQSSALHRFSGIAAQPDGSISLTVTSSVPAAWRNYYDLFPIEVSPNLVDWSLLATLFRTNRLTNLVLYLDLTASNHNQLFYRTPTNQLFTPIPPPDGPYHVGVISRLLNDPSRTNRYVPTNSSFMVSIWYPGQPTAGALPAWHSDQKLGSPGYCFSHTSRGFRSHSLPNVPVATNESKYPFVIYSHGHQLTRTDNTRKVENLASHGFIVLALDHINCNTTVFPNGQILYGLTLPSLGPDNPETLMAATNRNQDIVFLLNEAEKWNTNDALLQGHLDLDHVGIFGHSFGGGTSSDSCAQEPRIKAGLSLDGGTHKGTPAFDRPFLILSGGDNDSFMQYYRDAYRDLFNRLSHDAYWVHLTNSVHCDFNDTPWFDSPTSVTLMRRALVQDRYVVSFFRKYLRDEDDHLLDGPPVGWPEVDVYLKK